MKEAFLIVILFTVRHVESCSGLRVRLGKRHMVILSNKMIKTPKYVEKTRFFDGKIKKQRIISRKDIVFWRKKDA